MGTLCRMKLATFLADNGYTYADFAQKIGASTFAVGKWARGERLPRPAVLARITAATKGKVTANDFVEHAPVNRLPAGQPEAA